MTASFERHTESRQPRAERARGRVGRNRPARRAGIGKVRPAATQKQRAHARGFRCQHQAPQRDEIDRLRHPPRFDQHRAKRLAVERLFGGLQHGAGIRRLDGHEPCRIEPEPHQTRPIGQAIFPLGHGLPHPQKRAFTGKT